MKRVITAVLTAMVFFGFSTTIAQAQSQNQTKTVAEAAKERQQIDKVNRKKLNEKASKDARKEAKRLEKEGWKSAPGSLPIEKQLDKAYMLQMETNQYGEPEYVMADAMTTGGNYDAAKMQAMELAKQNLAGSIQTEVTSLIENSVSNAQMDQGDATSITKSIAASKNLITQSLGRIIPVVEIYRVVDGNNREVRVQIAYSMTSAKKVAMEAVRRDLEERGDALHSKLDQLLGW